MKSSIAYVASRMFKTSNKVSASVAAKVALLTCVIDSGATDHIFNVDKACFTDYEERSTHIHTANKNSVLRAVGIGTLRINIYKEGELFD